MIKEIIGRPVIGSCSNNNKNSISLNCATRISLSLSLYLYIYLSVSPSRSYIYITPLLYIHLNLNPFGREGPEKSRARRKFLRQNRQRPIHRIDIILFFVKFRVYSFNAMVLTCDSSSYIIYISFHTLFITNKYTYMYSITIIII